MPFPLAPLEILAGLGVISLLELLHAQPKDGVAPLSSGALTLFHFLCTMFYVEVKTALDGQESFPIELEVGVLDMDGCPLFWFPLVVFLWRWKFLLSRWRQRLLERCALGVLGCHSILSYRGELSPIEVDLELVCGALGSFKGCLSSCVLVFLIRWLGLMVVCTTIFPFLLLGYGLLFLSRLLAIAVLVCCLIVLGEFLQSKLGWGFWSWIKPGCIWASGPCLCVFSSL